jgi:Tol biopolymer transport system component/DNA-binding winged helix-turn-helix (wHTH) protein
MRHYRFAQVDVDLANLRVTVNGRVRPLEPKSFRLLQFLIENRGRAVPKDEIFSNVWADTFVSDNALTRAVTQIRKALDDDPKQPRFIETVPTVGYRFVPEYETISREEEPPSTPDPVVARRAPLVVVGIAIAVAVLATAGGWWLVRPGSRTQGPPALSRTAQLTTSSGLDVDAAWSPDGSLLAYSSDRSGSFEIYLRSRDAVAKELQLTNDGNQNFAPNFSPDGRSVVYSSLGKPGIYRVPALGGSVQRLTDFGAQPKWSPDGQWIVFVSDPKPTLATTDYYFPVMSTTLNLVTATGGPVKRLTSPMLVGGQTFPSWSTDSQQIRFVNYVGQVPSIWTYGMSNGEFEKRFGGEHATTYGDASFSRDSTRMYYVRSQLNGDIEIWMQPLDPATLHPSRAAEPLFQPSLGVPRGLALSPDERRLAFSATLAESKVMVRKMKGDSVDEAPPEEITHETTYRYTVPKWSPDSKSVVYTKFTKGRIAQTWFDKLDGSGPRLVGPGTTPQIFPQFTPDGNSILVSTLGPSKTEVLDEISLTDGAIRERAPTGQREYPDIAPDGSAIVYHNPTEATLHLYREDLKTGVRTQLTFGDQRAAFPRFSRDGKRVAFEINLHDRDELGVVSASGGPTRVFWDEPGHWFSTGWMPFSDEVLASGNRGGGWALYAIGVGEKDARQSTKKARQLTKELPLRMYLRYPEISRDGKRIVYEFNETRGNVFVGGLP